MASRRFRILTLFAVSLLPIVRGNFAAETTDRDAKPKITICKETTYITEPLRPDGYPDYVAAINQRMGEGVTPQNNAAAKLLQAFGPSQIPENAREKFYQLLGIAPLPAEGKYFVTESEIIKRWQAGTLPILAAAPEDAYSVFAAAAKRPWSAREFPAVAEWLKLNDGPTQKIAEASHCNYFFVPLVPVGENKPPFFESLSTFTMMIRTASESLITRAMNRIHASDVTGAWNDLLTVHRLARVMARGNSSIDRLIGRAIDRMANDADAVLLHHAKLDQGRFEKIQNEYRALSALPRLMDSTESVDLYERFFVLDAICFLARSGNDNIRAVVVKGFLLKDDPLPDAIESAAKSRDIDWNVVLKTCNAWFDRLTVDSKNASSIEQAAFVERRESEMLKLQNSVVSPDATAQQALIDNPKAEATRRVADGLAAYFFRGADLYRRAQKTSQTHSTLAKTAFALTAYRLETGDYPTEMAKLVPKLLPELPTDPFSNKAEPIKYRREGDAYAIWSVGVNGVDDDGKGIVYESLDPAATADDLVLRPAPRPKK